MKRIIVFLSSRKILNNIIFNNILIFFRIDDWFAKYINTYNYKNDGDPSKSLQEVAGYSNRPEINEMLLDIHNELKNVQHTYLTQGGRILDIGCGPGLFLLDFDERFQKVGIDITPGMIELAKKELPNSEFYVGDFMTQQIQGEFNMVFSVGTLIYISRSNIHAFVKKIDNLLLPGGVVFISYPHAISRKDLFVPDISYVQYSPDFIEKIFNKNFRLLHHARVVDKAKVGKFDKMPFTNLVNPTFKTYKNSSIIILQKK